MLKLTANFKLASHEWDCVDCGAENNDSDDMCKACGQPRYGEEIKHNRVFKNEAELVEAVKQLVNSISGGDPDVYPEEDSKRIEEAIALISKPTFAMKTQSLLQRQTIMALEDFGKRFRLSSLRAAKYYIDELLKELAED